MYLQPGFLSKMAVNDRAKQKRGEQNLVGSDAPKVKDVRRSLFPSNQSGKGNDNRKNNFGPCEPNGDEDCIPCQSEEMLSSGAPSQGLPHAEEEGDGLQGQIQAQELAKSPTEPAPATLKRKRGPTKLKTIALNGGSRIEVQFDEDGMAIGDGSVKLSSFLGALVRETVPYTLSDWRKLPRGMVEVLWQSIQARFNLREEWQRQNVFRSMNAVWRASKSKLVGKVINASNEQERIDLQPHNVKSLQEWKAFVKEKTSAQFKVKSDSFKEIRAKQLPLQHTMSRKGYARKKSDMKAERKVTSVSRVDVWTSGHTKKNGEPGNPTIAKTIEDMQNRERNKPDSTNLKEDALCEVLGAEKNGRVRTYGTGVTLTRLCILSQVNGQFDQVHKENVMLKTQMTHMQNSVGEENMRLKAQMAQMQSSFDDLKKSLGQNQATTERPTTSTTPPQYISHITKCKLLDWTTKTDDVVAEGRWISSDPTALVHCIPLGPNAMKVWVDLSKKSTAVFLWRPTSDMSCVEEALGSTIAWPADRVIIDS